MFIAVNSSPIKNGGRGQKSLRFTERIHIPECKPFLVATYEDEGCLKTLIFCSVADYQESFKNARQPLALQLMVPPTSERESWDIQTIASIRTGEIHVSLTESDEVQIQEIEQFITSSGDWLVFDSLESGKIVMPLLDEIYDYKSVCNCD